jgi:hypothetical protein
LLLLENHTQTHQHFPISLAYIALLQQPEKGNGFLVVMDFEAMPLALQGIAFIAHLQSLLLRRSYLHKLNPSPAIDFPLFDVLVI